MVTLALVLAISAFILAVLALTLFIIACRREFRRLFKTILTLKSRTDGFIKRMEDTLTVKLKETVQREMEANAKATVEKQIKTAMPEVLAELQREWKRSDEALRRFVAEEIKKSDTKHTLSLSRLTTDVGEVHEVSSRLSRLIQGIAFWRRPKKEGPNEEEPPESPKEGEIPIPGETPEPGVGKNM